jgi:methionyl-tRNA synthetase
VRERIDAVDPSGGLEEIWLRVKRLNQYVQDEEPWQLAKDDAQADRLDAVLYALAEGLRCVSVLLHPYMPASAERLLAALGREELTLDGAAFGSGSGGARLGELDQLFPRVQAETPA